VRGHDGAAATDPGDDPGPGPATAAATATGDALLGLYDEALPHVYGYLLSRCGGRVAVAQDLTTQAFLAAVQAVRRDPNARLTKAWLVAVARNKLVDHWRRQAREERGLRTVAGDQVGFHDPWDAELDALRAQDVLQRLSAHHRMVLTLRYLDDLPVPEVAALIGRTVHATEALLVRARAAFRRAYTEDEADA
jgi:RNA polymerase sigma-70 factor, ECF subfamily